MSRYSEKIKHRRTDSFCKGEPEDDFSIIPDANLRRYFRARAGLYGMKHRKYRSLKVGITPSDFKRLLARKTNVMHLPISEATSEALGEMFRDGRNGGIIYFWVYCTSYGGRMKVRAFDFSETSNPQILIPRLGMKSWGFVEDSKPLSKAWLQKGIVIGEEAA